MSWKDFRKGLNKYAPQIFTGIGVAGLMVTTAYSVWVTPKAIKVINDKKAELAIPEEEKLPVKEIVKSCWKFYAPAVGIEVCSIGSIIFAQVMEHKRFAAVATAAQLSQEAFALYKSKVIEQIGENGERKVEELVADEHLKTAEPMTQIVVEGKALYLEPTTGIYFYSDRETIKDAIMTMREHACSGMDVMSVSEFFYEIGWRLEPEDNERADEFGWNIPKGQHPKLRNIHYRASSDGRPCGVIEWDDKPTCDYQIFA